MGTGTSIKTRVLPSKPKEFLYENSLIPILNFYDPNNIIFRAKENRWDWLSYFFGQASHQALQNTFVIFLQAAYHFSVAEAGVALAFVAISVAMFAPIVLSYYQERGACFWAFLIQIVASFLFAISGLPRSTIGGAGTVIGLVGLLLISPGGTWIPAYPSLITKQYSIDDKGEVLGSLSVIAELSNVLAYPVGYLLSFMLSSKSSIRWPGAIWLVSGSYLGFSIACSIITMGKNAYKLVPMTKKEDDVDDTEGERMTKNPLSIPRIEMKDSPEMSSI